MSFIALVASCEDSGGPAKSGTSSPVSQNFTPSGGCAPATTQPAVGQQPGTQPLGTTGAFQLQNGQVTYEQDIKPLLKGKCFDSCHNGSRTDAPSWKGATSEIDYEIIKNSKTFIAQVVNGTLNHAEPLGLSADEIAKFAAWEQAGFPRGTETQDPQPGTGTNPTNPGGAGNGTIPSNPCSSISGETTVPGGGTIGADALDSLVNSELHKGCQAEGKLTDRKNNRCFDDVPLDMSWCNDAAIKSKFDELAQAGQAMANEISSRKGEGYEIEGCGVQSGTNYPHVSWIKRDAAGDRILYWVSIGRPPGAK